MRIAFLALLLLLVSAVVLIFANTLNSWVLGGLIGGLAAILLSIPISLIIFSMLARRHDEQLRERIVEDALAYDEYAGQDDEAYAEVYEGEAYVLPVNDEEYAPPYRQQVRGLPAEGQSYASMPEGSAPYAARREDYQDYRREPRHRASELKRNRGAEAPRSANRPGSSNSSPRGAHTTRSLRSQQQAAALRAARREKTQELRQDADTTISRRTATRHMAQQSAQLHRARSYGAGNQDWQSSTMSRRPHPDEAAMRRPTRTEDMRAADMDTEPLHGRHPATGPTRMNPETGKIRRNPQLEEQQRETTTGNLMNPLVRRAPYLYEDDPMREEFAQQIEKPTIRRSSRYLSYEEEEE